MEDERNWLGVDWTSKTHHVRVSDAKGRKVGERAFAHGGQGLAEMAAWILKSTGATPDAVFVAIEVPHGPVVESLMERGFRVHAINPKQLDRFRDRFSPAGAKDNSRDAEVSPCAPDRSALLPAPAPIDPTVVELRESSRIADTYAPSAIGSAIASGNFCGVIIRSFSNLPTISPPAGSSTCGV